MVWSTIKIGKAPGRDRHAYAALAKVTRGTIEVIDALVGTHRHDAGAIERAEKDQNGPKSK